MTITGFAGALLGGTIDCAGPCVKFTPLAAPNPHARTKSPEISVLRHGPPSGSAISRKRHNDIFLSRQSGQCRLTAASPCQAVLPGRSSRARSCLTDSTGYPLCRTLNSSSHAAVSHQPETSVHNVIPAITTKMMRWPASGFCVARIIVSALLDSSTDQVCGDRSDTMRRYAC